MVLLHGEEGKQLVVRLYDSDNAAERATKVLEQAHLGWTVLDKVALEEETKPYEAGRRRALFEIILSGAAGGALWGAVSGKLAGFGVIYLPTLGLQHASLPIQEMAWAETTLAAVFSSGIVGGLLGAFIGWGIQGDDSYLYNGGQLRGQTLLKLETDQNRAAQAAQILAQVNREVRPQERHVMA